MAISEPVEAMLKGSKEHIEEGQLELAKAGLEQGRSCVEELERQIKELEAKSKPFARRGGSYSGLTWLQQLKRPLLHLSTPRLIAPPLVLSPPTSTLVSSRRPKTSTPPSNG